MKILFLHAELMDVQETIANSHHLSHVYRHHRDIVITTSSRTVNHSTIQEIDLGSGCNPSIGDSYDCSTGSDNHSEYLFDHTLYQLLGTDKLKQQKKSAFFILYLKEIKGLSETAIQTVISGYGDMLQYTENGGSSIRETISTTIA